jgi:hypothetical protein
MLRRRHGIHSRAVNVRELRKTFLIVCEGEETEPNYFRGFRVPTADIRGTGFNTVSLVDEAIRIADTKTYDQVWCVFDHDLFGAQQFNLAISRAKGNGVRLAYSNEAFELWFLLHFAFFQTGITRKQYIAKLNKLIEGGYKKNDADMYQKLEPRQGSAIKFAKKLLACYNPCRPERDNPSTTVHLLVEELLRFSR